METKFMMKRAMAFNHQTVSAWMIIILILAGARLSASGDSTKTDWMYQAKVGVSTHYTASSEDLNRMARLFNVEKIAEQLAEAGAEWFLFTLHHQSWAMMAPNAVYDSIIGRGDQTAERDIPRELMEALARKGIRLMLYVNLRLDPRSRCPEDVRESMGGWPPNDTLIGNIAAVYREFSLRYGKNVAGWWIDGPHHPDIRDSGRREEWFATLAGALRAGNPDAILAFNYSLIERFGMLRFSAQDDYTAGETDTLLYVPEGRWVDGAQCHIWTFLGEFWSQPGTRFEDGVISDYAKKVTKNGGVLTLEVGTTARSGRGTAAGSDPSATIGIIDPEQVRQLKLIVKEVRKEAGR
jgi:hypothetical protein